MRQMQMKLSTAEKDEKENNYGTMVLSISHRPPIMLWKPKKVA
jgi:hypothetical protein